MYVVLATVVKLATIETRSSEKNKWKSFQRDRNNEAHEVYWMKSVRLHLPGALE